MIMWVIKMNVGERIKERRKLLEMSADVLAEKVGISRSSVFRYEKGDIEKIPASLLDKIATTLHTTPAYLMGWEKEAYTKDDVISYVRGRRIPILGKIAAGVPMLAVENIEGYEYADISEDVDCFFLRVRGNSMINARIMDGDLVLVKMQSTAQNGDIVACLVNGDEAMLKKFYRQGDNVILQPANPEYQPLVVPCADFENGYARILGVALSIVVKL